MLPDGFEQVHRGPDDAVTVMRDEAVVWLTYECHDHVDTVSIPVEVVPWLRAALGRVCQ